jgi:sulfur-oxidizing protein SoxZ
MASKIRMMVKLKNGIASVKAIIPHPMESGNRKDDDGNPIPAQYIQEVECTKNGESILKGYWGGGVQKNPFLSFSIKDAKSGDKVKLTWKDNTGATGEKEVAIK